MELTIQDGKMVLDISGALYPLTQTQPGCFFAAGGVYKIKFMAGGSGSSRGMSITREGMPTNVYAHVGNITEEAAYFKAFEGEYYCSELGCVYKIALESEGLLLLRKGAEKERLRVVRKDLLKGTRVTLKFLRAGAAGYDSFVLAAGRVQNLYFKKEGAA